MNPLAEVWVAAHPGVCREKSTYWICQNSQNTLTLAGMNETSNRRKTILNLALLAVILLLVYSVMQRNSGPAIPANQNDYEGLITQQDIEIEETAIHLLEHRITLNQAAIAAAKEAGERPEFVYYENIASEANLLGNLKLARETYEELLALNPIDPVIWNNYGNILMSMGDYVPAGEAFRQAIDLDPVQEYYRDYITYLERPESGGTDQEVLAALEESIETLGQTPWAMVNLAEWYLEHDDCEQALSHYEVAMQLNPENESIVKDYEEARATCQN